MTTFNLRKGVLLTALAGMIVAITLALVWREVNAAAAQPETPGESRLVAENMIVKEVIFKDGDKVFSDEVIEKAIKVDDEGLDWYAEIAKLLGVEIDTLWEAQTDGRSIADLAAENGVELQVIVDALITLEQELIDQMLEEGWISEEEGEKWQAEMEDWIRFELSHTYSDPFSLAMDLMGLDEESFWSALESGRSMADIAKDNGVDPQTIVDAIIAADQALIDSQIEAGLLTKEEAAVWREEMAFYAEEMVYSNGDDKIFFEDVIIDETFDADYPDPFMLALKMIGVDEATFWKGLEAGQSIADIATENGVNPQTIIDTLIASEEKYVDSMLKDGALNEDEATLWRSEISDYIEALVNNTQDQFFMVEELDELDQFEFEMDVEK